MEKVTRVNWRDGRNNFAGSQTFDTKGNPVEILTCRLPDPQLTTRNQFDRKIEYHQVVIFCSTDPKRMPCELKGETVPDGATGKLVPKEECDAQRELGACPLKQISLD